MTMSRYRTEILLALALLVATLAAYGQGLENGFVNYDDRDYVTENVHVLTGLTPANGVWAFRTFHAANWHPFTWLSLQLDVSLFGTTAWGFHLTSTLLHAASTVLLFLALRRMTGAVWPSALSAAFFALHPLHVESVAWVSERKDVLSGFFWILGMLIYAWYTERPGWIRYGLLATIFALGLLSKPMMVTFPCVLLLLDYWPLKRILTPGRPWREGLGRILLEKAPLFALTAAACVVTVLAQREGGAVAPLDMLPFKARVLNTASAYLGYLGKTFWPTGLAPFYPHPRLGIELAWALRASLFLAVLTAVALAARRRRYLFVGWFWFLGTLVPVIGLVQVGSQAMADRYTYIPLVGIFMALAWGAADLVRTQIWPRRIFALVALLLLAGCAALTVRQVRFWHNSTWLWEYATQVTVDSATAHHNLGDAYFNSVHPERRQRSAEQFRRALQINPKHPNAQHSLGLLALEESRFDEALERFNLVLQMQPYHPHALDNRGIVLRRMGRLPEAIESHRKAVQQNPERATSYGHMGQTLGMAGAWTEAAEALREAARLSPSAAKWYREDLAWVLWHLGEKAEAGRLYQEVLEEHPDWLDQMSASAWLQSTSTNPTERFPHEALWRAEKAVQASEENDIRSLDALAAAQAVLGDFSRAGETARKAARLVKGDPDLQKALLERARGYDAGRPHSEKPKTP